MYKARIVLDSMNLCGDRLTTFEVTFPRFILAEFNTHRALARNSASSRAIPVQKQLAQVLEDPFIPIYWGKNKPGMQATEELSPEEQVKARRIWLTAKTYAVMCVQDLLKLQLHKQTATRLLEPFMFHTVICSATEWQNFFNLRTHPAAQPEIQVIAKMMKELYDNSIPQVLRPGEWHLPYIEWDDLIELGSDDVPWVSAGKVARVSYLTHLGTRDSKLDLELAKKLVSAGHMSPLEQVAQSLPDSSRHGNFTGFKQLRKFIPGEAIYEPK